MTIPQQAPKPALNLAEINELADGAPPAQMIEWLEPHRFTMKAYGPDISSRLVLPESMADYVEAISKSAQTPTILALMFVLAVISACVQKRFVVSPSPDHTEPTGLWTVTALAPSNRKSSIAGSVKEPLEEQEKSESERLRPAMAEREIEIAVAKKTMDSLKARAAEAKEDGERKRLIAESSELLANMPQPLIAPDLFTTDITTEAMQQKLAEQGGRMAVISDEGGIFEILSGLYSDGKVNIDVFLQGYSGGSVRVSRMNRQARIDKAAIAIALTIQPQIISELQDSSKKRFRGIGLLSRFLYAIPRSPVGRRDVRAVFPVPSSIREDYFERIRCLLDFPSDVDIQTGKEVARVLGLSKDALELYYDFAQEIENKQGDYGEYAHIQDWTGKLPGQVLRIAAVCHLYEHGTTAAIIDAETIGRAVLLGQQLIAHAEIALSGLREEPAVSDARYIAEWIEDRRELIASNEHVVKHGDLFALPRFKKSSKQRLYDALSVLQSRHILSEKFEQPTRKPTYFYYVNPAFLSANQGES